MSVQINIKGTLIDFPSSGQSPNWAPAIIEFAQAVEEVLTLFASPFDVPPQVIELQNGVSADIIPLKFPTSNVRSINVRYSIFRQSDNVNDKETESGNILVTYDGTAWYMEREFMSNKPTPSVTFQISSTGQFSYTSVPTIDASNYVGKLSFSAQTLSQA